MKTPYRIYTLSVLWLCMFVAATSAFEKSGEAMNEARQKLQKKDYVGAQADADVAGSLAQTPSDKVNVTLLMGQIAESAGLVLRARTEYEKVAADPQATIWQKGEALNKIAYIWLSGKEFDKALAIYIRLLALPDLSPLSRANAHLSIGRVLVLQENWVAARAEFSQCLAGEKVSDTSKFAALSAIAGTFQKEENLPEMKKAVDAALMAKGSVPANSALLRGYALLATEKNELGEAYAAWSQIVKSTGVPVKIYSEAVLAILDSLVVQGKLGEACQFIDSLGAPPPLLAEDRVMVRLLVLGMNSSGKEGLAKGEVFKAVEALSAEQKLKVYGDAAKFFMKSQQYGVVNEFIALKDAMYREEPQKIYPCQFMDRAPSSIDGWMASALVKDPRNRESRFEAYDRKAAERLIVDVRSERVVGDDKVAADKETGFYMACDDRGWHIFVKSEDAEVEKVAAGLIGGGQLEMSFTTAYGAPYFQWIINLQTGKFEPVDWGSPARGFRLMEGFYKSETLLLDKSIGSYIFFPWEMLYDRLPKNGDKWPFSVIRWTRAGGITTGGKVHEIHKWGVVQWNGLTPEHQVAIKRKLVMKALGNYRKVRDDLANFWKDDEHGDPEFYKSTLLPVLEQLDAPGQKVAPDMAQFDVEALFETMVPDWMEFKYKVAELRSDYLAEKWLRSGPVKVIL